MSEAVLHDLLPVLEELKSQVAALSARIEKLEGVHGPAAAPPVQAAPPASAPEPARTPPSPAEEAIADDVLLAISAAVAAFLGVRARIRQIRLIRSPAWAQQGRVSIQASHRLH